MNHVVRYNARKSDKRELGVGWKTNHVPTTTTSVGSILEYVVVENLDFRCLDSITKQIEKGTMHFISDKEGFVSNHEH